MLGAEIEDGTAVYLLSKPIARSRIIVAKLLAAWTLTTATVLSSGLVAGADRAVRRAKAGSSSASASGSPSAAWSTRRSSCC